MTGTDEAAAASQVGTSAPGGPAGPDVDPPLVPDLVQVAVEPGGRLLVLSDLRLRRAKSETAVALSNEVARVVEAVAGPCTLVLAGDTFDLAADTQLDPGPVLATHQRLTEAIGRLAGRDDSRVLLLPGSRDASLAWHAPGVATVAKRLGAMVALAVEADIRTGSGEHRVRVEPGTRFDEFDARDDPRNPQLTTPGDGIRRDLAQLASTAGPWLDGIETVADPARASAFVASRLFYRRALRNVAWLVLPFLASIALLIVGRVLRLADGAGAARAVETAAAWSAIVGVALVAAGAVFTAVWWWTLRDPLHALALPCRPAGDEPVGPDGAAPNAAARFAAGRLIGAGATGGGLTGLVTGHTGDAELTTLGPGFYANPGGCGPAVVRRAGRFGAPDAWAVEHRWSWLSVEAGAELSVKVVGARRQPPTTTLAERLWTRARGGRGGSGRAEVIAAWPDGPDWPVVVPTGTERRRARRIGAFAIALAGVMNLVSAVLPPLRDRFEAVEDVLPLVFEQAAAIIVALSGLLLLLLARGIRRGQRHAWIIAEVTLAVSVALHVVKGLDFEEAIVATGIAWYLYAKRRWFTVRADDFSVGRGLTVLVGGLAVSIAAAVAAIKLIPGHHHDQLGWWQATQAAAERLVGDTHIAIGGQLDRVGAPVLVAIAVGLIVYAGWTIFGPVVAHRLVAPDPDDAARARAIVEGSDGGTLAYFALRDDKRWFFWGDTLVAYAVSQGVALVSPDPIGPVAERRSAWFAFRRFADAHGWPIAVMGASEEWLGTYRASGMRDLYVGDEAVVDVQRFSLDGPRNKAVRQAVNRVARQGYTVEFVDPSTIDAPLEAELRGLMTESRRGEMERGFSMTLGRIFDPRDTGLLLAVCRDADAVPVAFCQFVPAPGIGGFSLDLMRRSESDRHPNGLTDFVIASTMLHLKAEGFVGLALNFATMRGVLAGERGDGTQRRVERWIYRRMSDSMQIESLWRYNAKFDPDWVPRYACYDAAENLLASATALAKAESWWEIPVVGRFFKPADADADGDASPPAGRLAGQEVGTATGRA